MIEEGEGYIASAVGLFQDTNLVPSLDIRKLFIDGLSDDRREALIDKWEKLSTGGRSLNVLRNEALDPFNRVLPLPYTAKQRAAALKIRTIELTKQNPPRKTQETRESIG